MKAQSIPIFVLLKWRTQTKRTVRGRAAADNFYTMSRVRGIKGFKRHQREKWIRSGAEMADIPVCLETETLRGWASKPRVAKTCTQGSHLECEAENVAAWQERSKNKESGVKPWCMMCPVLDDHHEALVQLLFISTGVTCHCQGHLYNFIVGSRC